MLIARIFTMAWISTMIQNINPQDMGRRLTEAGRELTKLSLERAAEVAASRGVGDMEIHALLTAAIDGTVNARRLAETTAALPRNAMRALDRMRQAAMIEPGTTETPQENSPWYLTATGETVAHRILRPSGGDPNDGQTPEATVERAAQTLERTAVQWP